MGRKGSRSSSEVIRRLVELGTGALVEQLELPAGQAQTVMREVAHLFATEYGGNEVYIAKDTEFALTKRDMLIFERMERGSSTVDVARDFELTTRQVQIITRHVREQGGIKARQNGLPGFEDALDR